MTFSTRISLSVSGVILACFIVMSYVGYTSTTGMIEAGIREQMEDHVYHAVDKLDRMLHERHADMRVLSRDPVVSTKGSTPREITERLKLYRDEYGVYSSLSFFDMNRVRLADTSGENIGQQHALTDYWREIQAGRDFVMKIAESNTTGRVIIHFVAAVKDRHGERLGVVAARMPVESIYELVEHSSRTSPHQRLSKIELLDRDGLILYSSYNKGGMLKEKSGDWEFLKTLVSSGRNTGSARHSFYGEDEISAFAIERGHQDFRGNGWVLVICTSAETAFAPAHAQGRLFTGLISVFTLIVLATTFLVSKSAVSPLKRLAGAASEIGKGNFGTRVSIAPGDEIGQLAAAFNNMAADLSESEKRYRSLAELLPQAVYELDCRGRITFANRRGLDMFGYTREDVERGMDISKLFVPDDIDRVRGDFHGQLLGGKTDNMEYTALRKDGSTFPILTFDTPILREDKIVGLRGIGIDITERKKTEELLKQRRRMTERLNNALVSFAKDDNIYGGNLETAFRNITETTAEAADICRVSIWFYTEENSGIKCMDLYDRKSGTHSGGHLLDAAAFPSYFSALQQEACIAVPDALSDPRTREFSGPYLKPLGITSMLDVPIRASGRVVGVVCHEHTGPLREWTVEEQSFATAVAGFTSVALEINDRMKAEESLRESEGRIKRLKEEVESKLDEVERINKLMVGREIKMEERRREIERLKARIAELEKKRGAWSGGMTDMPPGRDELTIDPGAAGGHGH